MSFLGGAAVVAALFSAACAPSMGGDAATAAARVKGGMDAQVPGASMTAIAAGAGARVPSGAVSTVQASANAAGAGSSSLLATVTLPAMNSGSVPSPDQIGKSASDAVSKALGVPADQVKVDKVEAVQWSDASLGCPEAGRMYAQVLTPGFRIMLTAGIQKREVHTDMSGRAVICQTPSQ